MVVVFKSCVKRDSTSVGGGKKREELFVRGAGGCLHRSV